MATDRRTLIASAACAMLLPRAALARDDGFAIDWQGMPVDPALADILARQIAGIRALPIDPAAIAFFAAQPVFVIKRPGIGSLTDGRGVFITRDPFPVDNPVLLHELLHRYHGAVLPDGFANRDVWRFYAAATARGDWPAGAYLYSNDHEFFAMTASCVLHGHTARPPYTRAAVRRALPDLYAWIVAQFRLRT